jgi:hypothetical protein
MKSLLLVAMIVLVMRVVDLCWMVIPAFGDSQPEWRLIGMVALLVLGIGGLWFGYFSWQLQRLPLLPANDPRMEGATEHAVGHAPEHG